MVAPPAPVATPLLGWLVDPSLETQEAGIECAPLTAHQTNKWQWRATDFNADERQEMVDQSPSSDGEGDERDAGATNKKKRNIFRRLKHHHRVSSTDAVAQEMKHDSMLPTMIHIQRASSIDSVECVLADVFLLPTASSTLTEDDAVSIGNDSATTVDTVVIDEEEFVGDLDHVPCDIQLPTEHAVECVLAESSSSLPSVSSSAQMTVDSGSDDDARMADLDDMENDLVVMEGDDAWSAAKKGDLEALQRLNDNVVLSEEEQQCLPVFCYSCHAGDTVTTVDDVLYLMQGRPEEGVDHRDDMADEVARE